MTAREVVLCISGMSCQHCRQAVEKALSAVSGVHAVSMDLQQGLARMSIADNVERSTLVCAVERVGFSVLDS
ncbi:MAG: cation transporter [Clostridia bacterium]|nr:cation transporter [Clostridia bacterium]